MMTKVLQMTDAIRSDEMGPTGPDDDIRSHCGSGWVGNKELLSLDSTV